LILIFLINLIFSTCSSEQFSWREWTRFDPIV
jgi:hypothetical protein